MRAYGFVPGGKRGVQYEYGLINAHLPGGGKNEARIRTRSLWPEERGLLFAERLLFDDFQEEDLGVILGDDNEREQGQEEGQHAQVGPA